MSEDETPTEVEEGYISSWECGSVSEEEIEDGNDPKDRGPATKEDSNGDEHIVYSGSDAELDKSEEDECNDQALYDLEAEVNALAEEYEDTDDSTVKDAIRQRIISFGYSVENFSNRAYKKKAADKSKEAEDDLKKDDEVIVLVARSEGEYYQLLEEAENYHPERKVVIIKYDSDASLEKASEKVAERIKEIYQKTQKRVNVVGHGDAGVVATYAASNCGSEDYIDTLFQSQAPVNGIRGGSNFTDTETKEGRRNAMNMQNPFLNCNVHSIIADGDTLDIRAVYGNNVTSVNGRLADGYGANNAYNNVLIRTASKDAWNPGTDKSQWLSRSVN